MKYTEKHEIFRNFWNTSSSNLEIISRGLDTLRDIILGLEEPYPTTF